MLLHMPGKADTGRAAAHQPLWTSRPCDTLGVTGSRNWNGVVCHLFLTDHDAARFLGDDSTIHLKGERNDYDNQFNTQGLEGNSKIVTKRVSDHFSCMLSYHWRKHVLVIVEREILLPVRTGITFSNLYLNDMVNIMHKVYIPFMKAL